MSTTSATLIKAVSGKPLCIELFAPFTISRGAQERADNVLVAVELACGVVGYGEAAPFPSFNGETQEGSLRAIAEATSALMGRDIRNYARLIRALRETTHDNRAAQCALEVAILDAFSKYHGCSLWSLFGGSEPELHTDVTITTGSVDEARTSAMAFAELGFRQFKVKIGGASPASDLARIAAIRSAIPGACFVLDGNAAMSQEDALATTLGLLRSGVTVHLLEQPVPPRDLAQFKRRLRAEGIEIPVAADEALCSARDAVALIKTESADVFNIKLMKCGVLEALDIVGVARANGIGLMIGGMVESVLSMSASACFAGGLGGFSFVDLDTPLFMKTNPFSGGFRQTGPLLEVASIQAGHGAVPTE